MCNVCSTVVEKANDVEENPGPTIYDVVDPSKTICAVLAKGIQNNLDKMLVNNV